MIGVRRLEQLADCEMGSRVHLSTAIESHSIHPETVLSEGVSLANAATVR